MVNFIKNSKEIALELEKLLNDSDSLDGDLVLKIREHYLNNSYFKTEIDSLCSIKPYFRYKFQRCILDYQESIKR